MRLFILPSTQLQIKNDDYDEFFTAPKGKSTAEITALWKEPVCLGNIVIKENILCGQRVEAFTVEVKTDGDYRKIYSGTVIGYKRIVPLNNVITDLCKNQYHRFKNRTNDFFSWNL